MRSRSILGVVALVAGLVALLAVRELTATAERAGAAEARPSGESPQLEISRDVVEGASPAPTPGDAPNLEPARDARRVDALIGRVLREDTREPLEGFHVQMKRAGSLVAERASDARGAFALPRPVDEGATVAVEAPFGWLVVDPVRAVAPDGQGPKRDLEFLARPAGFARFRARLVDVKTFAPVPSYMVHLGTRDGRREEIVSDAEGRLASEQAYPEGTLLLFGYDLIGPDPSPNDQKPDVYREIEHRVVDGESTEVELAILVGATYRLALDLPADIDRARLTASLLDPAFGERLPPERGSTPVRWPENAGDGPWVRFRRGNRGYWAEDEPLRLCVISADGLYFGEAPVLSCRGVYPSVVAIRLEARARIVGRVVDPEGEAIARARVEIARRVGRRSQETFATAESGGNGVFEFKSVAGGTYELRAVSAAHERRATVVDAIPGERVDLVLELPRARDGGAISGRVVAPLERGAFETEVRLDSTRPRGRSFATSVALTASGDSLAGEFRFEHVPEGDYELSVAHHYGGWTWRPRLVEVSPPASAAGFALEAAAEPRLLVCEVADKASGELLTAAWFEIHSAATSAMPVDVGLDWGSIFASGDFAASDRWWVGALGYTPYSGSPARDFVPDGERWIAKVALERGFGLEIDVVGPRSAPIGGAEVWCDGEQAATTDAAGHASPRRARAPDALEVRYRDWIVEPADREALREALTSGQPHARVRMSPP